MYTATIESGWSGYSIYDDDTIGKVVGNHWAGVGDATAADPLNEIRTGDQEGEIVGAVIANVVTNANDNKSAFTELTNMISSLKSELAAMKGTVAELKANGVR